MEVSFKLERSTSADSLGEAVRLHRSPVTLDWHHKAPPESWFCSLPCSPGSRSPAGIASTLYNGILVSLGERTLQNRFYTRAQALFQMGSIPKQHRDLSKQGGVKCDISRQLVKKKGKVKSQKRNV